MKESSHRHMEQFRRDLSSMALTVTLAGRNSSAKFPFVRVPWFELAAGSTRQDGVGLVAWNPIVQEPEREKWSQFANAEKGWIVESREILQSSSLSSSRAQAISTFQKRFGKSRLSTEVTNLSKNRALMPHFGNVVHHR